jgi:2-oxoglutarate ferredoxin oxidoreductase subunit alpha
MKDFLLLVGGKAGDGINRAGFIIARLLSSIGYRIYMYYDYPSLIRGGHNFSIIRAAEKSIGTHHDKVDFLLAFDQNTVKTHSDRISDDTEIIFNADTVKTEGMAVPIGTILEEEGGLPIMANICLVGSFCKCAGISWEMVEKVLTKELPKKTDVNLRIARRGYDMGEIKKTIEPTGKEPLPLMSGNEAIGLGLLYGGLDAYVAYPMTPSTSILHFLADQADKFSLKVLHPENEIAVMLMAQGFAYGGLRTAVGTSGGGFCLMTEGLSMAGMTEVPVTIVISQRGGPSTGIPTYTAQSDLHFVLHAGQGDFPRFLASPGNAEQAFEWSARALSLSWKYQVPSFILVDKSLSEGLYSFERGGVGDVDSEISPPWDGNLPYRRYADTETGISPLAPVPTRDVVVKVNSYAHDEEGITTEKPDYIAWLNDKHMRKEIPMLEEVEALESIACTGKKDATTALLCWGSNAGVCTEVAVDLGLLAIQPIVLAPFPIQQFIDAFQPVERLISVEDNISGQLTMLVESYGICVDETILRYDGRPSSYNELKAYVEEMIA